MNTLPSNPADMLRSLQVTHTAVRASAGDVGKQFLRLLKSGQWAYGAESVEVEKDALWAVDPSSFVSGYICWDRDASTASVLGEEMRPATDPPIVQADLPNLGHPWQQQLGVSMLCISGEDDGVGVQYTTTSKGGRRALNDLLGHLIQRLQSGQSEDIVPVIKLGVDSYRHKKYGIVYTPELIVQSWAGINSVPAASAAEAEPEPEPEEEESPPPRRRRRRIAS